MISAVHSCTDEDDTIWKEEISPTTSTSSLTTSPSMDSAHQHRENIRETTDIFLKPSISNEFLHQAQKQTTNSVHRPGFNFNAILSPPTIRLMKLPFSHNVQRRVVTCRKRSISQCQSHQGEEMQYERSNLISNESGKLPEKKSRSEPTVVSSSFFEFPFSPLVTKTRSFQKLESAAKVQRLCNNTTAAHKAMSLTGTEPCSSSSSSCTSLVSKNPKLRQLTLTTVMKPLRSLTPSLAIAPVCPSVKENLAPGFPIPPTPSVIIGNTMRRNDKGETPLHIAAIKV